MPTRTFPVNDQLVGLDARPDRLDFRDRIYTPRLVNLPPSFPDTGFIKTCLNKYLKSGLIMDQGSDGACTGFALAAIINYLFWLRDASTKECSPRMIYHLAQLYDEWPGEDYVGSSCRGALKGWQKHGVCSRDLWPYTLGKNGKAPDFEEPKPGWQKDALRRILGVYYRIDKTSVTDMQAAIQEIGAVYVSGKIHQGWALDKVTKPSKGTALTSLEQLPLIPWHAEDTGVHAFALIGYTERGFVIQNSWGSSWGFKGLAILSYDDWLNNGGDAWTLTLGVPIPYAVAVKHTRQQNQLAAPANVPQSAAVKPSGSGPLSGSIPTQDKAGQPNLSIDQAYGLTVVMGNDGALVQRLLEVANAAATVEKIVLQAPQNWFRLHGKNGVLKLALYAHGGLNSEDDSLKRIAAMAPYFLANGIYPVFITWKTGLEETLDDILKNKLKDYLSDSAGPSGDWLDQIKHAATDVLDRTVESLAESLGGKALWVQMKQNAAQAVEDADPPHGLLAIADRLKDLSKALGKTRLEIHLVGHSAGAIVQGHLLNLLATRKLTATTCSLYAPACSIDFAETCYRPAMEKGVLEQGNFHIHMMSDMREQDDNVAGIYQKSLLYLVARAFENRHKTPLLGMACSLDAACFSGDNSRDGIWNTACIASLKSWNKFYWGGKLPANFAQTGDGLSDKQKTNLHIINDKYVNCGKRNIPLAHTSFGHDINVVSQTLARILGLGTSEELPVKVEDLDY